MCLLLGFIFANSVASGIIIITAEQPIVNESERKKGPKLYSTIIITINVAQCAECVCVSIKLSIFVFANPFFCEQKERHHQNVCYKAKLYME